MLIVRRRGNRDMHQVQQEMEDIFHSMLSSSGPIHARVQSRAVPVWRPLIDVYETEGALVVLVELAGMSEDQIEVVVDESFITIRGERLPVCCDERRTVHAMGILYGPFAVKVYLPFAVNHDSVAATYQAGLLEVRLPREAATHVPIGSGANAG